jgi:glycosyltransferase involved in cell wall biosynthesis
VADSAEDFAESVALVLQDQGIRRRLEQEGRRTAESTYSWDIVGAHLNKEYRLLINEEAS